MHFFQELYQLSNEVTLSLIITSDQVQGTMTICVFPKPRQTLNEPALLKDLTLTGTPDEFEADFITALTGYRTQRDSLRLQAETTHKVLERAQAASAKTANQGGKPPPKASVNSASTGQSEQGSAPKDTHVNNPPIDSPDLSWRKGAQPQLFEE
ncbi:PRTRC system protein E [Janthinobacterium sp. NKUCC06_STL]|uniref:PRTRC system protein E n=1 Tax=Janthinobacterium sp. NKUCC06_STL TaxID=2842127 RepID=UPI001C5B3350|nr:PRTRC system protein E [Janthinobacterium sp. NKUCC06_STL]MBW3512031.1 PRTRC system protein E [Janthinobacterium sp. NKUCC06_STL]